MALEKIRQRVKYSTRGPLFAGKGFGGLGQKGRFLWAPERFGRFGPELFSALSYPLDFRIMSRTYAWVPPHQIFLVGELLEPSYDQKHKFTF